MQRISDAVLPLFVFLAMIGCILLLTLLWPAIVVNLLPCGINWTEKPVADAGLSDLAWSEQSAVSPDRTKVFDFETDSDIVDPRHIFCDRVLTVRDAISRQVHATLGSACESGSYPRYPGPGRAAWLDKSTLAVDTEGPDGIFLWKWEVFAFPFGVFWLIVWGIVVVLAVVVSVVILRRRSALSIATG